MAAFTKFSKEALEQYLKMFGRGRLIDYSPTAAGIDNSNYFVELEKDGKINEFVLTIMENHTFDEAPFFSKLLTHLHHYGLPVPTPQSTLDGMTSTIFCGKPTFLVRKLPGSHFQTVGVEQCRSIGEFLAAQHKALGELNTQKPNNYSVEWMVTALSIQEYRLSIEDSVLLEETIEIYRKLNIDGLPVGLIHGDLFRDNALFIGEKLTGIIDYYRACEDLLSIDLAVAINDWCRDENEIPDEKKRVAMIDGYNAIKPLTDAELSSMIALQQVSAARFALTRLLSGDPPLKDPGEMLNLTRMFAATRR